MRFKAILFMSVLAGTFGLAAVPAAASTATSLPLTGFYQIVVDSAHGHVFLSQGGNGGTIVVTNLAGQVVTTIPGETGAAGMALSADGSTLYAALPAQNAVSAISTATLQQTTSYSLGSGNSPSDVVVQSGNLWVSYTVIGTSSTYGAIAEIDPATGVTTLQALPGPSWYEVPELAADPLDSGTLVAAGPGLSAAPVASYDVATTPAKLNAQSSFLNNCEFEEDLAVAPGGAQFVLACGAPYEHYRYSTANLGELGYYPSSAYPNAVAIAANGTVAAGVNNTESANVYVYRAGVTAPLNTYSFAPMTLAPRGLAWSADGSRLYAVAAVPGENSYALQVLDEPTLTASTLALSGTSSAVLGHSVSITGRLSFGAGEPPAGTTITITRLLADSTATAQFTVQTAADGTFKLTDTPSAAGRYTYTAAYGGSTTIAPSTATRTVTINRIPTALSAGVSAGTVNYRGPVTVTAHLGTTYTGRTVSIYAQPFGSKTRQLVRTGDVDSSGSLTARYAPSYSTAFSVVFGGDARYAPRTVTRDVDVRARVTESISGYYATTHIGGTLYRVYHHTATLRLNSAVAPDKAGECLRVQVQVYYRGSWRPDLTTDCVHLSKSSTASGGFSLSKAAGYRWRIKSDYIRSSKDDTNLSNDSYWLYLEVVK